MAEHREGRVPARLLLAGLCTETGSSSSRGYRCELVGKIYQVPGIL